MNQDEIEEEGQPSGIEQWGGPVIVVAVAILVVGMVTVTNWTKLTDLFSPIEKGYVQNKCVGVIMERNAEFLYAHDTTDVDPQSRVRLYISPGNSIKYSDVAVGDTAFFTYSEWQEYSRTHGKWSKESELDIDDVHPGPNNPTR